MAIELDRVLRSQFGFTANEIADVLYRPLLAFNMPRAPSPTEQAASRKRSPPRLPWQHMRYHFRDADDRIGHQYPRRGAVAWWW